MLKNNLFPSILQPDGFENHMINGLEVSIPIIRLEFKRWQGPPIANTFGGKGLIDFDNEPVFAELAIVRLASSVGWNARWVETYAMKNKSPYYFSSWSDGPLPTQTQDPITDKLPLDSLALIAKQNDDSYYGCWDTLLWKDDKIIYAEVKRSKKDRVRVTQDRWLEAGFRAGLGEENFMIVWWDFE